MRLLLHATYCNAMPLASSVPLHFVTWQHGSKPAYQHGSFQLHTTPGYLARNSS